MFKLGLIFSVILLELSLQIHSKDVKSKDSISDLLDELKKVVNKSISDATVAVVQEAEILTATAVVAENDVETTMLKILDDFKAEINAFMEVASENGVDAEECFPDSEQKLNQTITADFKNFADNVSLLVLEGDERVGFALTNIQKAKDEVAEIEKAIEDCGIDDASENCLDDLSTRIQRDIESIPDTAAHEVETTKKLIESICPKIVDIAIVAINQGVIEANRCIIPALECINGKLNGQ